MKKIFLLISMMLGITLTAHAQLGVFIKGGWVKVKTTDGKHTGWIQQEWLCGNPVTNCC